MQRVKIEVVSSELKRMPHAETVVQDNVDHFIAQVMMQTKTGEVITIVAHYTKDKEAESFIEPTVSDNHPKGIPDDV